MYDLEKIIIVGNWCLKDKQELQTIVMKTDGLKVESLLYIGDKNSITTESKKPLKEELVSELYSDQYDEDELIVKIKEAVNGEHAIKRIAKFINKIWNENTLLYFYNPDEKVYDALEKELYNLDGSIFLSNYYDIFVDGASIEKDIYTIMKEQGLKVQNLIKDSQISFAYFLSCLVEKLLSK